jgi:LysR family transcriptional activator of nhaA
MDWLNYHHLLYFWTVAREGSIARAGERLHLSPPTISAQLRRLERSLKEKLFRRVGRNLVLTDAGQFVFRYADEIFTLGKELMGGLQGRPTGQPLRLVVGIADVVPKLIAYRLIEPALRLPEPVQVICHEDRPERLLAELSVHGNDIVLTDAPLPPTVKVRAYSHLLGECSVTVFAAGNLAAAYRRGFPQSLDGAPFLLPTGNTTLRRSLDQWLESQSLRPVVRGEFQDSALMKSFGQAGEGLFVAASVIEDEIRQQYGVQIIGRIDAVRERFYAVSVDRRLKHPAVVAISEGARQQLFG